MRHIFAIGDLHGHAKALDNLLDSLDKKFGLFKERNSLVLASNKKMIFIGDYIDRGKTGRKVLDTVMRLEEANPRKVVPLMGNHELMALASLGDARQLLEDKDEEWFKPKLYGMTIHGYNGGMRFINEFDPDPMIALEKYVDAMHRDAPLGKWFRSRKPYTKQSIGDRTFMFCHAGIPDSISNYDDLKNYSQQFREHMNMKSYTCYKEKYLDGPLVGDESLFWIRGEFLGKKRSELESHLHAIRADFSVVGHTPSRDGKIQSFHDLVFDIDVGMTPEYGKNTPAALVISEASITAFYCPDSLEKLLSF